MYETAAVLATEKCALGAKIRKMSLQASDSCAGIHWQAPLGTSPESWLRSEPFCHRYPTTF